MFEFSQGNPILIWYPVVERDFGQERFLTENPTKLFRQGRFMRVPVIAGITEFEFLGPAIGKNTYYTYMLSFISFLSFRHTKESRR